MKYNSGKAPFMISGRWIVLTAVLLLTAGPAMSQQGATRGKLEAIKDPELETACKHNLEVARYYNKHKGYAGARDRLQEILDTYPDFSKIDEVIYLMGEVNEKLRKNDEAAKYYAQIVKNYPGSQFFKKAKEQLAQLNVDPSAVIDASDKQPPNAVSNASGKQPPPAKKSPSQPNGEPGTPMKQRPKDTPEPPPPF